MRNALALAVLLSGFACLDWTQVDTRARTQRCVVEPMDPGCAPVEDGGSGADGGALDAGAGMDAGGVDAGTTFVVGHRLLHYRQAMGPDLVVSDELGLVQARFLLADDAGAYVELPLILTGDGGYRVNGVPEGRDYLVQLGTVFVLSSARDLNLDDFTRLGRPRTVAVTDEIGVQLDLSGVPDDLIALQFINPGTDTSGQLYWVEIDGGRIQESSRYQPFTGGLPDGTNGDEALLLASRPLDGGGGMIWNSVTHSLALQDLQLPRDGGLLQGTFVEATRQAQAIEVRVTDFLDAGAASLNPTLYFNLTPSVGMAGLPARYAGYPGTLLSGFTNDTTSPLLTTLDFGRPKTWPLMVSFTAGVSTPTLLSGTTSGGVTGVTMERTALPDTASPLIVIAPRVSAPQNLKVDGMSATSPLSLSRLTPTVTWTAPAEGADQYAVTLRLLTQVGMRTQATVIALFFTRGTSLTFPAGRMESGKKYALTVTALKGPTLNAEVYASIWAADLGSADLVSSILTAP